MATPSLAQTSSLSPADHRPPLLATGLDRQSGPVTITIRGLRPNELPSWEMRERQMEEERKALRDLRKRIAKAVSDGIALLDQLDGDADLEPSLGSIEPFEWQGQETWTAGSTDERENAQCIGCDGDYVPSHRGFLSRVA